MSILSLMGTVQDTGALADKAQEVAATVEQTVREVAQNEGAWGWGEMLWTTLICICLVFFVLILLVGVMKLFGYAFVQKPAATASGKTPTITPGQIHEEEIAAIATALKLYKGELHDRESEVLTIMSIKRAYSPWNSKIHGLTQLPDRK